MPQKVSKITEIKKLEPAIYEVAVVYIDGTSETKRMSVFDLNALKFQLGMPTET